MRGHPGDGLMGELGEILRSFPPALRWVGGGHLCWGAATPPHNLHRWAAGPSEHVLLSFGLLPCFSLPSAGNHLLEEFTARFDLEGRTESIALPQRAQPGREMSLVCG